MPFQAQCMFCGQKVKVPDRALGTSGKCPKCNNFFTLVPGEEALVPDKEGPYGRVLSRAAIPRTSRPQAVSETKPTSRPVSAPLPSPGVSGDEGPPPCPWIEPFGLGALLLSGGALLCASSPALAGLVVGLCIFSVLAGLLSLLRVMVVGQFRLLFPVAGALLAFAVLSAAFLFPALLGPTYLAAREKGSADSTTIRVVPLKGGPAKGMANPDWVDARHWALLQGGRRVQVNKVWVGPLTPVAKAKKGEKIESYLFLQVNVHQVESPGEFSSAVGATGMDQGSFQPRLMDNTGKDYPVRVAGAEGTLENVRKSELFPVAMMDHLFVFQAPASGLDLRLEISAQGDRFFRFQIPAAMIQNLTSPRLPGK